jgi:hypothetical protein
LRAAFSCAGPNPRSDWPTPVSSLPHHCQVGLTRQGGPPIKDRVSARAHLPGASSPKFPLPCRACAGAHRKSVVAAPCPIAPSPTVATVGPHRLHAHHLRPTCPLVRRAVASPCHFSRYAAAMPRARSSTTSRAMPLPAGTGPMHHLGHCLGA